MLKIRVTKEKLVHWLLVWMPVLVILLASFLPLKMVFRQLYIGMVLLWFGLGLMLGHFC